MRRVLVLCIVCFFLISFGCSETTDDSGGGFAPLSSGDYLTDVSIPADGDQYFQLSIAQDDDYRIALTGIAGGNINWSLYDYISDNAADYSGATVLFSGDSHDDNSDEIRDVFLTAGEYFLFVAEYGGSANMFDLSVDLAP